MLNVHLLKNSRYYKYTQNRSQAAIPLPNISQPLWDLGNRGEPDPAQPNTPPWHSSPGTCARMCLSGKAQVSPVLQEHLPQLEHPKRGALHVVNCSCSRTEKEASPGHRLFPTTGKWKYSISAPVHLMVKEGKAITEWQETKNQNPLQQLIPALVINLTLPQPDAH